MSFPIGDPCIHLTPTPACLVLDFNDCDCWGPDLFGNVNPWYTTGEINDACYNVHCVQGCTFVGFGAGGDPACNWCGSVGYRPGYLNMQAYPDISAGVRTTATGIWANIYGTKYDLVYSLLGNPSELSDQLWDGGLTLTNAGGATCQITVGEDCNRASRDVAIANMPEEVLIEVYSPPEQRWLQRAADEYVYAASDILGNRWRVHPMVGIIGHQWIGEWRHSISNNMYWAETWSPPAPRDQLEFTTPAMTTNVGMFSPWRDVPFRILAWS